MAIGAVAFGIAALTLASGFIERLFLDFREDTIKSQLGHVQIVKAGYHEFGRADPNRYLLPEVVPELPPSLASRIRAIAPHLSFGGLVSHGDSTLAFIGDGVSPKEEAAFEAIQISVGHDLSVDEPRAVTMGEGLARNLGVAVGDHIVLLANTASGGTNAVEVSIRGLFSSASKAYDDAALRVPIETARELLRVKGSHVWVVLLRDTADTDAVLTSMREHFVRTRFDVIPWYQLADFYNKTKALFTKQIYALRLLIALIILLTISNTMMMNVLQRTGEIGTSMALGVSRAAIVRQFLAEGTLLGCFGGVLGLLVGVALATVISAVGIPMPPPPGKTHGYMGGIMLSGDIALNCFALAIMTTLFASMYPAWRSSRMQIVDALRHNR